MAPTIGMYSFECSDAVLLAEFWAQVMGKHVDRGASVDYATLDFDAEGPTWMFVRAAGARPGPNSFTLDLTAPAYEAEAERIERLGAERAGDSKQGGVRWTVFGDPDGNTFRLFAPRPSDRTTHGSRSDDAAAITQPIQPTMPAHSPEEIHALLAAAVNAADLDAFAELHEDNATVIVPPDGQRVSGRDAIRAAVQPIFALAPVADIEVVGKLEGDDLALTHARVSVVATDGAESLEISGRGTIVSRRQPDGTWRIVLDNPMSPD
jgi:uncharacterized protein (TIGR02246 family)